MKVETGFADVEGAGLYYEAAGGGPPLVFVHGYSLDLRMWDDQFERLATQHRVVRYDQRGFGHSGPPTAAPYSNHEDLRRLLDFLGVERAHVCGLSSGGGVAIDFALEHPDRVLSLVLIASAVGGSGRGVGSMTSTMIAMSEAGGRGDLAEAKRLWVESPLFAPAKRNPAVANRLGEIIRDWSGWHLMNQGHHIDPDPPAYERLGQLAAPALVLVGELDNEVVQATAVDIEDKAPNARRVSIPDVGHIANMEAPETVNEMLATFLG